LTKTSRKIPDFSTLFQNILIKENTGKPSRKEGGHKTTLTREELFGINKLLD